VLQQYQIGEAERGLASMLKIRSTRILYSSCIDPIEVNG
jgi:hypothetical protein